MKTVKEISELTGVSRTSIYNLIKKKSLTTSKIDGVTYVDDEAEALIMAYYSTEQQETINDILNDESTHQDGQAYVSGHLLNILENELNEKNKTIQGLIQALTQEKQYQTMRLIADSGEVSAATSEKNEIKKESIFTRFFRKR